jgi:hypothetical protein
MLERLAQDLPRHFSASRCSGGQKKECGWGNETNQVFKNTEDYDRLLDFVFVERPAIPRSIKRYLWNWGTTVWNWGTTVNITIT